MVVFRRKLRNDVSGILRHWIETTKRIERSRSFLIDLHTGYAEPHERSRYDRHISRKVFGPRFSLPALRCLIPSADLPPAICCAALAACRLSHGEDPALDPQPGEEDCDAQYASRIQGVGEGGFLPELCSGL